MATLTISSVSSRAEFNQFERVPEVLHRGDPAFVPPFPGSVAGMLSSDSPFQMRHGSIHGFIAKRGRKCVGRIAAVINRSHNNYQRDQTGFFGFFACENNPESAAALFDEVDAVLRAAGMNQSRGPYNPSINDDCGLLVDSFDQPPRIGLTWNPGYYPSLLTANRFKAVRTMRTLNLPMHRLPKPERLGKIVERIAARSRLTMRTMDFSKLESELEIVREVYNSTLARNWGFVPISMEDLLAAADDIRAIADPKLLLIAEMDGQDAGVAITLPNFNEVLARTKSTPHWLRLPHIFLLMKTMRIRSCRQTVLGVVPGCRDRGLHAWLIHEQFVRAQERFSDASLGWVEENNEEIFRNCEIVGGEPDRTWKIFQRTIAGSKAAGSNDREH